MIPTDQKLPILFGDFYLYDLIGLGGMAEIFLAKEFTKIGTANMIVIKRILPHLCDREGFGDMLIAEAKLCSRLSHANVVQTFDLGQIDGQYYIGMEYVEGFDLNRLLGLMARAKLSMPLQFALHIIIESLRGLDYAHRVANDDGEPLGIIHRDVSPTNILISVDGDVKVCDFGIAKVTLDETSVEYVDEYHLKGKVAYMSPEHLNGEGTDIRSDLYAAGILLWELLSGRRLFKTKDEEETLRRAKNVIVPSIDNRDFPNFEILNDIVLRGLEKDPKDRFQTGREFIDALQDYMMESGLIVSSIKFADFLMDNFGENLVQQRMEREQKLVELRESQPEIDAENKEPEDQTDDVVPLVSEKVSDPPPKESEDDTSEDEAPKKDAHKEEGDDRARKRTPLIAAAIIAALAAGAAAFVFLGQSGF